MANRTGRLTNDEKHYIESKCDSMPVEDIAANLRRTVSSVKRHIVQGLSKIPLTRHELAEEVDTSIMDSLVWKELEMQFSKEELKKFMFYWRRILAQFGGDILATEEMQAVDYIRLELLSDRILQQQQENLGEVSLLEQAIEAEKKLPSPDMDKIQNLRDQIEFRRASQESTTKEYKEIFTQKGKVLDQMKATRTARIKTLENKKESIPDWIKSIVMSESKRRELGIYMEKMRLAMKHEEERLAQFHTYADDTVDIPLLTVETLKDKKDG